MEIERTSRRVDGEPLAAPPAEGGVDARRLTGDERGATAIEYGLIAALVVIGLLGVLGTMSDEIMRIWEYVGGSVVDATSRGEGDG